MPNELWECRPVESLESQKQASHPFHRPWKARKGSGLPTFPQLRRLFLYKGRTKQGRPDGRALKPSPWRVGQNKLPKWAKITCQTHGVSLTCPWHAWEFDCGTGALDYNPAVRVATFPVRIAGDEILIDIP